MIGFDIDEIDGVKSNPIPWTKDRWVEAISQIEAKKTIRLISNAATGDAYAITKLEEIEAELAPYRDGLNSAI